AINGSYAYVTGSTDDGIAIFKISGDASFDHVTSVLASTTGYLLDEVSGIDFYNDKVYVTSGVNNALLVFDASDAANLVYEGILIDITLLSDVDNVLVRGNYAYVTSFTDNLISLVNISSSTNMSIDVSFGEIGCQLLDCQIESPSDVALSGDYAYVTLNNASNPGIQVFDIADPLAMTPVGFLHGTTSGASLAQPTGIHIIGKYGYVSTGAEDGLVVIDINGIKAPAAQFGTLAADTATIYDDFIVGGTLSVGDLERGGLVFGGQGGVLEQDTQGLFYSTASGNLGLGTNLPQEKFSLTGGNVFIQAEGTDSVGIVSSGACFATSTECPLTGAVDVFVHDRQAYVLAEEESLHVIGVADPNNPEYIGGVSSTSVGYVPDLVALTVKDNYAFTVSQASSSIVIYDVEDPTDITQGAILTNEICDLAVGGEGCALEEPNDITVEGAYAYVASGGEDGISIFDLLRSETPIHEQSFFASTSPGVALDDPTDLFIYDEILYVAAAESD
ncbi:MAG: hypothetical protein AAFO91_08455, partial [Bacteroidota bacterium]